MKLSNTQQDALNIIKAKTNVNGVFVMVNTISLATLTALENKGLITLIVSGEGDHYARLEFKDES